MAGLVILGGRASPQQTNTTKTTTSPTYWWLEVSPSPFGGRNYNFDEIQRGEHILNNKKVTKTEKGTNREVKKINKRQTDYDDSDGDYYEDSEEEYYADTIEDYYDETEFSQRQEDFDDDAGGVIALNEIETECPAGSSCVESFFCAEFSGQSSRDKIPCLLNRGEFAGEFGICCKRRHSTVCPKLRTRPNPEDCLRRPLGDPEDEECPLFGVISTCPSNNLCCFNGCINVCLEDPPHTVEESYWVRQRAVVVGRNPSNIAEEQMDYYQEEYSEKEYGEGGDYSEEVLDEVFGDYSDYEFPPSSSEDVESNTSRADRVLLKLIKRLRSRISS